MDTTAGDCDTKGVKAVTIWREITSLEDISIPHLFSFRELAMYLEHREKNYEEARKIAEEGYVLSRGVSSYYEKDFEHRRARLKQKIKRQSEKDSKQSDKDNELSEIESKQPNKNNKQSVKERKQSKKSGKQSIKSSKKEKM